MKLYRVRYDCSTIVIVAQNKQDLFNIISEEDDSFYMNGNDIYISLGSHNEKCDVE